MPPHSGLSRKPSAPATDSSSDCAWTCAAKSPAYARSQISPSDSMRTATANMRSVEASISALTARQFFARRAAASSPPAGTAASPRAIAIGSGSCAP